MRCFIVEVHVLKVPKIERSTKASVSSQNRGVRRGGPWRTLAWQAGSDSAAVSTGGNSDGPPVRRGRDRGRTEEPGVLAQRVRRLRRLGRQDPMFVLSPS